MHGVNMDIRGMHGATPTLAQGSGVNRADARLVRLELTLGDA